MRAARRWHRNLALLISLTSASAVLQAQPFIFGRGILNAGSYMPASLPGGSIAQGSIFSIFGTGLGPTTGTEVSSFPLGTTVSGVSVKVFQGNVSVDAIPIFVLNSQLNVIMPSSAPLGRASVQVTYLGQTSNASPVTIVLSSFGILTVNSGGYGPGVFTNASYQYISLASSATPGQPIILWGTGLGPIATPDNQAPPVGSPTTQTEVFVGGESATLLYSGRAPCCSGLDQIVFTVPPNAATGCWVPVQVRTGGTTVSNTATLAISADGSPCSDPFNPIAQTYLAGNTGGLIALRRLNADIDQVVPTPVEANEDFGYATMLQPAGRAFFFNSLLSLPPPGTCGTFTFVGDISNGTLLPGISAGGTLLDAGNALEVAGVSMPHIPGSLLYDQLLGSDNPSLSSAPLVFQPPASVLVSGPRGADVGAFQASVPTSPGVQWTNRDSLNTLDRTQSLAITWDPASATGMTVVLVGGNVDTPHNASTVFVCTGVTQTGSISIPAWTLSNVPPTGATEVQPKGLLFLAAIPLSAPGSFSASGLDTGSIVYISESGKAVIWQ